jgi:hypothetical protein
MCSVNHARDFSSQIVLIALVLETGLITLVLETGLIALPYRICRNMF